MRGCLCGSAVRFPWTPFFAESDAYSRLRHLTKATAEITRAAFTKNKGAETFQALLHATHLSACLEHLRFMFEVSANDSAIRSYS